MIMVAPKFKISMLKNWTCSRSSFKYKNTLHCAEGKAKLLGNWTMQQLKLKSFRIVNCFVSIYVIKSFKGFNLFSEIHLENEHTRQTTDQEGKINLGKNVFDDNNQEKKLWSRLGQTCSRSSFVFLTQLFVILLNLFGCSWKIHVSKICERINCLGGNFMYCSWIPFTFNKTMNNLISSKSRVFISLVGSSETANSQLTYNWLKIASIQQKLDKIYFISSTRSHLTMLCKKMIISSLFRM